MEQRRKESYEKYCSSCGAVIHIDAEVCPHCGVRSRDNRGDFVDNHRTWLIVLLMCLFIGPLGLHRFYVGKIGTGILMILTAGGLGIWVIVDLVMIVTGNFTDKDGYKIS
jgi:RNA polymerase subunit RPABC4/transcription elongation factor Spt4